MAIDQSVFEDLTHHSFDRQFYPTVQNQLVSATEGAMLIVMKKRENRPVNIANTWAPAQFGWTLDQRAKLSLSWLHIHKTCRLPPSDLAHVHKTCRLPPSDLMVFYASHLRFFSVACAVVSGLAVHQL